MTGFKINSSKSEDSEGKSFADVYEMVFDYAKRETLKPIRGAGRWIAYGLLAALCRSAALVFGALGVLRLLQTSDLGDSSSWSWLNYLLALAVCVVLFFVAKSRIRKGTLNRL